MTTRGSLDPWRSGQMDQVARTGHEVAPARVFLECSTPKGITGSGTIVGCGHAGEPSGVLNAEGHHGVGHAAEHALHAGSLGVLNAEGHHGVGHLEAAVITDVAGKCSTPKGITGSGTQAHVAGTVAAGAVLNAEGHHGVGHMPLLCMKLRRLCSAQRRRASRGRAHSAWRCMARVSTVCSTPKGITGSGTRGCRARSASPCSAQRRRASRGRARTAGLRLRRRAGNVLNAEGHHGVGH